MKPCLASRLLGTACCLITIVVGVAWPAEPCQSSIPLSLRTNLKAQFSNYRLPRLSDSLPEDIEYSRQHGGNGCLGVAVGDFDGNGAKDFGLILTRTAGRGVIVVVALSHDGKWQLEPVEKSDGGPARLFIERAEPGEYVETEAGDDSVPAEPKAREKFRSSTDGLYFGWTESSARAYFRTDQGWVYVQVSD